VNVAHSTSDSPASGAELAKPRGLPRTHYFSLLWFKTYADLRAEAARTYLNFLWWIVEPVLYMAVFYVVFGVLFKRGDGPEYVPFLLCGLAVWKWFDSTLRAGANAIQMNAALIGQVFVPKAFFPSVTIAQNLVKYVVVLAILLIFLQFYGPGVNTSYLALPLVVFVQFLFITGCTFLLAAIVPFMPDILQMVNYALTLLLFLSGIFYSVDTFPDHYQIFFALNPMVEIIESYRDVLLYERWPDFGALALVAGVSLLIGGLGLWIMARFERVYPRVVL